MRGLFEYDRGNYVIMKCEHGRRFIKEDLLKMFTPQKIKEAEEIFKM